MAQGVRTVGERIDVVVASHEHALDALEHRPARIDHSDMHHEGSREYCPSVAFLSHEHGQFVTAASPGSCWKPQQTAGTGAKRRGAGAEITVSRPTVKISSRDCGKCRKNQLR